MQSAAAHDVISTKLTWTQEVSRIVYKRCGGCHRAGGSAPMPLVTYEETRPWAKAIKEEVLERRMPPWGAMKGFGDFAADPSLSPEEIHVIADWVEGGAPEGDPQYLPEPPRPAPAQPAAAAARRPRVATAVVANGHTITHPTRLESIRPVPGLAKGATIQVAAQLPDGSVVPLLWLYNFNPKWTREYVYRHPQPLPAGTRIRINGPGRVRLGLR